MTTLQRRSIKGGEAHGMGRTTKSLVWMHRRLGAFLPVIVLVSCFIVLSSSAPRTDRTVLARTGHVTLSAGGEVGRAVPATQQAAAALRLRLRYVFGVSTGHAGSAFAHAALKRPGCPWPSTGRIELTEPSERARTFVSLEDECNYTRRVLLPFLDARRGGRVWVDLGHFHNRGRVLECAASLLGDRAAFVRIRRNRYHIARSFAATSSSPCNRADGGTELPWVSVCPHSSEGIGPVDLPVRDGVWERMTPFQKFLWYADEMEHRFHAMRRDFPGGNYLEVTWSSSAELKEGMGDVREGLGCSRVGENAAAAAAQNKNQHVSHKKETVNCSGYVLEDLAYRRLVAYSDAQSAVLFKHPQHVGGAECMDTEEDLINAINTGRQDGKGISTWVLPGGALLGAKGGEATEAR